MKKIFKKVFIASMLLATSLMAELQHVWSTPAFMKKDIKIIDIRTPQEWKETGIVKGSYTIMFFDEEGNFNVENFMRQLNMVVKKDEPFALICRVGSRTGMVSEFLSNKLGYKVINLKGGIMKAIYEGYRTVKYP
ncbi:MAG: Rhodanese-like domain-containing protein [uncultured Sulfurovum sp.]|uniref:Rhodanese-like domain-containing protein n=1 Tax=uncultured Sulfurovum sp. TaxID=269237 RepID=A0A6S6S3C7_9BACT|nr:MAG: Rhodanese-like domain-containing protein [uncultured Sulfurovum sp.]